MESTHTCSIVIWEIVLSSEYFCTLCQVQKLKWQEFLLYKVFHVWMMNGTKGKTCSKLPFPICQYWTKSCAASESCVGVGGSEMLLIICSFFKSKDRLPHPTGIFVENYAFNTHCACKCESQEDNAGRALEYNNEHLL